MMNVFTTVKTSNATKWKACVHISNTPCSRRDWRLRLKLVSWALGGEWSESCFGAVTRRQGPPVLKTTGFRVCPRGDADSLRRRHCACHETDTSRIALSLYFILHSTTVYCQYQLVMPPAEHTEVAVHGPALLD